MQKLKIIRKLLLSISILSTIVLFPRCNGDDDDMPTKAAPNLSLTPTIEFTAIPSYGTSQNLIGKVNNIYPQDYKIAVYILVEGYGWVIKPTSAEPLTSIQSDCSFTCNVVTGGQDEYASCIAGFLLPNGTSPPLLAGSPEIPDSMFTNYPNLYKLRYGRTINFASREWWVKNTVLIAGPGPNYFSDNPENVRVENNRLHLKITRRNNVWYCPEVICKDVLDYGEYVFRITSPAGSLDNNVVCGMFTWDMSPIASHREIDIEFIKNCSPSGLNAQYVIQPYNLPGNLHPWTLPSWVDSSTHIFEWKQDVINFKSYRGLEINSSDTVYQTWTFSGSVPQHNKENVRINLWLCNGNSPVNMQEAEVIIYDFGYSESH